MFPSRRESVEPNEREPVAPAPGDSAATLAAHDVGLLVVRLGVGLIIAAHGAQHLFGWWGGPGITKTALGFASFGYPAPKTMAIIAGLAEALGGLGLAVGLLTPLAGAAVAATMANAFSVVWKAGFFGISELALLIGICAAGLALSGPGRIALDAAIPGLRSHRLAYGVAALLLGAIGAVVTIVLRS